MTYGKKENGEGIMHLSKEEVARFEAGKPIVKHSGYSGGDFKITLQLEMKK